MAEEVQYSKPSSYNEAMQSEEWERCMQEMIEKIESLLKNGTWVLIDKPDGRRL